MGQLRSSNPHPGDLIGGRIVRYLYCAESPPLAIDDWPVRRGYETVTRYAPRGTLVVLQPNVKPMVEPAGTFFETEDAIVYDVTFTAVIVSWMVSE